MKKFVSTVNKSVSLITAAVLALFSTVILCGCSWPFSSGGNVEFTRPAISLTIGEEYELTDIIVSDTDTYTLSSSDASIASIAGTVLTARGIGKAVITIDTVSSAAELRVTVSAEEESTLSLTATGDLIQTLGSTSEVSFKAVTTGDATKIAVDWYLNRIKAATLSNHSKFSFIPTIAGEFTVEAECAGLSAKTMVRVYRAVNAVASYVGEIRQLREPYTNVTFSVDIEKNIDNPVDRIQWYVDGNIVSDGTSESFVYRPSAGAHAVSVKVNGVTRLFGDASSVNVYCVGSVTPAAPTFEFDNLYPHAYIKYDVLGDAMVEITAPTGTVTEYAQTDNRYVSLFDENGFDAGSLIELCSSTPVRGAYKFRVKSLGDGGALTESDYSKYFTFTQLSTTAKPYIENRILDADLYITSDEEYVAALEYFVVFRSKTTKLPKVEFECYIAYDMSVDAKALWNNAFPIAATSGTYNDISVTLTGSIMRTYCVVDTVNAPTRQTKRYGNDYEYSRQLHAVIPHINYDESEYRPDDYVFPIDRRENTESVAYSDELYYAAARNTRPIPKTGSAAETVYNTARSILRKICTDAMTDVQKAHAIYDWIMWQVTYDTPATETDYNGEKYSAYYLEGVFGDGKTKIGGVAYAPYAVCDGISKAYALMCNIEGIPCVRVSGQAGDTIEDTGGHAWNKVFVDGQWYIVDCTWGDLHSELTIDGVTEKYELGLHDWLFLTDAQADDTHFEPYEAGESFMVYAPPTTTPHRGIYSEMTYNGVVIDCEISAGENKLERVREISKKFARAYTPRRSVFVPGGVGDGEYPIIYEGFEIYFNGGINIPFGYIQSAIDAAIMTILPDADVKTIVFDNVALVLVR